MKRKEYSPPQFAPIPRKAVPSHTYVSDGTGRDSYVIQHSGGLVSDYRGLRGIHAFKQSLRQHAKLPQRRRKGSPSTVDITEYNNWYAPHVKQKLAGKSHVQRNLVQRLSPVNNNKWRVSRAEYDHS
jgi:hypothetical protein